MDFLLMFWKDLFHWSCSTTTGRSSRSTRIRAPSGTRP